VLRIDRRLFLHFDWALLAFTFFIPLCGLVVLYSAGYDEDAVVDLFGFISVPFASAACLKQLVYFAIGLVVMVVGMSIPTHIFQRYAFVIYALGVLLLLAVDTVGVVVKGSQRWLDLGGFNLQPAECMKLGVLLAIARVIAKSPPREGQLYSYRGLVAPCAIIALPMVLIMKQPDLGTALSLAIVGCGQLLFVGIRPRTLLASVVFLSALAVPSWYMLHDYQQRRVLVLLDPESDPQGSGYHITQSKIAVGSGEFLGKGYREGTQTQLEFLPEHTTDFVFSVLAEEWGFVGCFFLLSVFLGLLAVMLRIAHRSRDLFACMVTIGVATQLFAHIFINIGMVIGLMPVVGIPLPLVSYGGSSMLSLMFGIGIVQGVSMRRMMFRPT
jgi:rod shape determining protein RodA